MDSVALRVLRDERDIERPLNLFARAMDNQDRAAPRVRPTSATFT